MKPAYFVCGSLLAGLLLAGCSPDKTTGEPAGNELRQSADAPTPDPEKVADTNPQALQIGVMHAPQTDAYCTFMQASHTFTYDDPATWRFVFLREMDGAPPEGQIKINEDVLTFQQADLSTNDEGIETWHYRSTNRGILVEFRLKETDSGPEHTDYEGTMAITEPAETERMRVKGSCGV